jgi:hypothetical protein
VWSSGVRTLWPVPDEHVVLLGDMGAGSGCMYVLVLVVLLSAGGGGWGWLGVISRMAV